MKEKDGGWDLSDLEKEIDSAVETLLVNKGEKANSVTQPQKTNPPVEEAHIAEQPSPSTTPTPPSTTPTPSPSPSRPPPPQSPPPTRQPVSQELQDKLEAVEAQLLTLEWDISSKHLNNAITHLQDFRGLSHIGDELEKIIILIQKVLYQLTSDESKLTPAALKFLQKAWKAVKGMTDERFSLEIDKKTLVQELIVEFQNLRMEEKPQKKEERIEARPPQEKRIEFPEERVTKEPHTEKHIPFSGIDKFMHKIEQLLHAVSDERRRLEGIHQEIVNFKGELQNSFNAGGDQPRALRHEGIAELEERLSKKSYPPSVSVFLFKVSGVMFGLPEQQIIRSFPIKKWVSEFFIEKGKVKLKDREIPLFNILQVFKLKPTTEENPHVLLIKGREDRPAAIIIDQAIPREEIEYKPIDGKPYIFGQGAARSGTVWILDAEQISP
jgi:chemotaxis protein histidine kinase CheA